MADDDHPKTVEGIYADFEGRRSGLIKALTTEYQEFFNQCGPEEQNPLSLYGHPNGNWEVRLPAKQLPTDIPEPTLGINFARDKFVLSKDWLSLVAVYSDSWLIFVAFGFAGKSHFQKSGRAQLFSLINDLPTVSEAVSGFFEHKSKEATFDSEIGSSNKSAKYSGTKLASEEDGGLEEENALCGACGEDWGGFWIACDACKKWFHGKCVKVTQAQAKHIEHYNCPSCDPEPLNQSAHG